MDAGTFYSDGQQRDEDFNRASVQLSRMGHAGVTCLDCHDPHTTRTILPRRGHSRLARHLSHAAAADAGRRPRPEAAEALRQAERAEPRTADYPHALATVLQRLGDRAASLAARPDSP